MRYAALILGGLMAASLPTHAQAQSARAAFQDNYFFVFNGYLAPGEQPIDEKDTRESAIRRAHGGFVEAEVKSGRYTEEDRQVWIDAWSQAGSTTAGLNLPSRREVNSLTFNVAFPRCERARRRHCKPFRCFAVFAAWPDAT